MGTPADDRPRILVVDDDAELLFVIEGSLQDQGFETRGYQSAEAALAALDAEDFDAVVTDLRMPLLDGVELCDRIVGNHPTVPVVLMTAYADVEAAVLAMRAGALDFITKPFSDAELAHAVQRALRWRASSPGTTRLDPHAATDEDLGLLGRSPAMEAVRERIRRVAKTDATVLISGESGTGKELVARAVHRASSRSAGPFVPVNCAAIPGDLLESELFGHVKGAFTGAETHREGLMAAADGGTLLLDEVGAMPLELQPKVLRALQSCAVRPVGGTTERPVNIRIVAATNADLGEAVRTGKFRSDLYYRLNVVSVELPPLRDRGADVTELAEAFLSTYKRDRSVELGPDALKQLRAYPWPGNVRELENCVHAAVTLAKDGYVGVEELPTRIRTSAPGRKLTPEVGTLTLEAIEREHIETVLRSVSGNKARAAEVLGIDRSTLYRKLKRYGLDRRWL